MRHTRSHTNNRRSHHALSKPTLAKDEAGNLHLRHRLSEASGTYRGRKVVDMSQKLEKKAKKLKEKSDSKEATK